MGAAGQGGGAHSLAVRGVSTAHPRVHVCLWLHTTWHLTGLADRVAPPGRCFSGHPALAGSCRPGCTAHTARSTADSSSVGHPGERGRGGVGAAAAACLCPWLSTPSPAGALSPRHLVHCMNSRCPSSRDACALSAPHKHAGGGGRERRDGSWPARREAAVAAKPSFGSSGPPARPKFGPRGVPRRRTTAIRIDHS